MGPGKVQVWEGQPPGRQNTVSEALWANALRPGAGLEGSRERVCGNVQVATDRKSANQSRLPAMDLWASSPGRTTCQAQMGAENKVEHWSWPQSCSIPVFHNQPSEVCRPHLLPGQLWIRLNLPRPLPPLDEADNPEPLTTRAASSSCVPSVPGPSSTLQTPNNPFPHARALRPTPY